MRSISMFRDIIPEEKNRWGTDQKREKNNSHTYDEETLYCTSVYGYQKAVISG